MASSILPADKLPLSRRSQLTQTVFAVYGYAFLEWLYFAAKSFSGIPSTSEAR